MSSLRDRLTAPNFGDGAAAMLAQKQQADPRKRTAMLVDPFEIDALPGQPRRDKNPAWDEIESSVLTLGRLNNPLPISRNPETGRYVIYRGGNTRLAIVQRAKEGGDGRFDKVDCVFEPWDGWLVAKVAHWVENEARGGLRLIDKGLYLNSIKGDLELLLDRALNNREMERHMSKRGAKLSRNSVRNFLRAAGYYEYCPLVLDAGAGTPFVQGLAKTENAIPVLCRWLELEVEVEGVDSTPSLEVLTQELFYEALRDGDRSDGLSVAIVDELFIQKVAGKCGVPDWQVLEWLDQSKAGVVPDEAEKVVEGDPLVLDGVPPESDMPVSSGVVETEGSQVEAGRSACGSEEHQYGLGVEGGSVPQKEGLVENDISSEPVVVPVVEDAKGLDWAVAKQILLTMGESESAAYSAVGKALDEIVSVDGLDAIIGAAVAKKQHLLLGGAS